MLEEARAAKAAAVRIQARLARTRSSPPDRPFARAHATPASPVQREGTVTPARDEDESLSLFSKPTDTSLGPYMASEASTLQEDVKQRLNLSDDSDTEMETMRSVDVKPDSVRVPGMVFPPAQTPPKRNLIRTQSFTIENPRQVQSVPLPITQQRSAAYTILPKCELERILKSPELGKRVWCLLEGVKESVPDQAISRLQEVREAMREYHSVQREELRAQQALEVQRLAEEESRLQNHPPKPIPYLLISPPSQVETRTRQSEEGEGESEAWSVGAMGEGGGEWGRALGALIRGHLIRRLFATQAVQMHVNTIKESMRQLTAIKELEDDASTLDTLLVPTLLRHVTLSKAQLRHIFLEMTSAQQMELLRRPCHRVRERDIETPVMGERRSVRRAALSSATLKALARRSAQADSPKERRDVRRSHRLGFKTVPKVQTRLKTTPRKAPKPTSLYLPFELTQV